MSESLTIFGEAIPPAEPVKRSWAKAPAENPCIRMFGAGPEGQRCKDCRHLVLNGYNSRNYWKCDLRRITSGAATDHRVSWPACAMWDVTP